MNDTKSFVLIETSWNVKALPYDRGAWHVGINRNIVECKVLFFIIIKLNSAVLIETSWNVKMHSRHSLRTAVGINRNIVECKG